MRRILLGLFLLFWISGWGWAGSGVYTLTGMVVTGINPTVGNVVGKGDPLGGVEIEVEGTEFRAQSSANGFFHFEDLPDGEYRLIARKAGYPDVSQKVRVNYSGMSSRCQILMNPREARYVDNMAAMPGDLFVAYSRKPDNLATIESSPFQNLWQKMLAAGMSPFPRQEDLPFQPKGWVKEVARVAVDVLPQKLAIRPDGKRCLVTNKENNTVSVIDIQSSQVVGTTEVGKAPVGVCYSRDGRHAYVACKDSGVVMVLDGRSGQVLHTTIPLPHAVPTGLTIMP